MSVIDFAVPHYYTDFRIVTPKHSARTVKPNIFLRAYSAKIWISIIASGFIAAIFMKVLSKFSTLTDRNVDLHRAFTYKPVWYTFSMMVFKGFERDIPRNPSSRIFTVAWSFAVMIIVYAFSGMIISSASLPDQAERVDDLDTLVRLVEKGVYNFTVVKGNIIHNFVMKSNRKQMAILSSYLSKNPDWISTNYSEAIKRVFAKDQAFAYMEFKETAKFQAYFANKPELHYSMESQGLLFGGNAFRKNFSQKNIFNLWTRRIFDSGLLNKWHAMALAESHTLRKSSASPSEDTSSTPTIVMLIDLIVVLYIFIFGQSASIVLLIMEIINARYQPLAVPIVAQSPGSAERHVAFRLKSKPQSNANKIAQKSHRVKGP